MVAKIKAIEDRIPTHKRLEKIESTLDALKANVNRLRKQLMDLKKFIKKLPVS